jgi:ABC-type uncharacterized transport system substrate-binding protein
MGKSLMPGNGTSKRMMTRCVALLAALTFAGCSIFTPEIEPVAEPEIVSVPVVVEPEQPTKVPEPEPEPPRLPPVAIVLTSSQPAFMDVANALTEHLDDFQIFDLSDSSKPPVSVLRVINDSNSGTVVAIGLRAAKSSVAMANMPVIFSQVFNHQDHGLLTEHSRGIAPLAPLDAQLAAWTEADPTISRIGIIVGEGHDELITEARIAAQKHNIELRVRIAHSDQETLYLFRRMSHDIDGFWLFPDNRILSARSLQQILESAKRGQVAVAVPYESMLTMGATISMATQAEDIAATIAKIIRQIHDEGLLSVPAISPLSAVRVVKRGGAKVANR